MTLGSEGKESTPEKALITVTSEGKEGAARPLQEKR